MAVDRMGWLPAALAALAILVVLVLLIRRRRRRAAAEAEQVDEIKRLRAETALSELRDMREALGPAAHNRVERRRNPQPGSAPKIERRRKGARRGPE
jgi:hypothetical protein